MDGSVEAMDASAQSTHNNDATLEDLLHGGCKLDSSSLFRRVKTIANSELRANPKELLALVAIFAESTLKKYTCSCPELVFVSKLLLLLLEDISLSSSELPKPVISILTAWALSTSLLLRSHKPRHRKLAVTLSRRLWRKDKQLWDILFQEFQSARLSAAFLPVLSIGCSFGVCPSESAECDKLKVLKRILEITLAVKKPSQPVNLEFCSHLLNYCIDENTFVSELIPASHRSFLRTPETAVSVVNVILKQLDLKLDKFAVDFIRPLANNLLSTDVAIASASSESILATALLCGEHETIAKIFELVLQKLTGPDGRRANLESRRIMLDTLGNLSLHKSNDAKLFPVALAVFVDLIGSEVSDEIVECVLLQLCRWLKRTKCPMSEKAQTLFKDRLSSTKTSPNIRLALLKCLDQAYRSGVRIAKTFTPLLVNVAQSANTEAPASPKVSEALAAACLWLQMNSTPEKTPDSLWVVLEGIKVDRKESTENAESLPIWLRHRFILAASEDVQSYLVHVMYLLLSNHPSELSDEQKSSFYRTLLLLWLYTDSKSVLADIRCCLTFHAMRDPSGRSQTLLASLNRIVDDGERARSSPASVASNDLLCVALGNVVRFGNRLVHLVNLLCSLGAACKAPNQRVSCLSRLRLTIASTGSADAPTFDLSIAQRLSLFFSAVYALSHSASAAADEGAWRRLCARLILPDCAEAPILKKHLSEEAVSNTWQNLAESVMKFPALDRTRRLYLQRLLQWAPVTLGSFLSNCLSRDLSDEYLSISGDEVAIMLTEPGMLYNKELLNSLPRYQVKSNIQEEDLIPKKSAKQPKTFLESLASELTARQMETVMTEMKREEEIRTRMLKLYQSGIHRVDVLTTMVTVLRKLNWPELQQNFLKQNSSNVSSLTLSLLSNPLLAPSALYAHEQFFRLMVEVSLVQPSSDHVMVQTPTEATQRKAVSLAAWTARVHRPARLLTTASASPVESKLTVFRTANTEWLLFCRQQPLQEHTNTVLHLLAEEIPQTSVASTILLSNLLPVFVELLGASPFNTDSTEVAVDNAGTFSVPLPAEDWSWVTASLFCTCICALRRQLTTTSTEGSSISTHTPLKVSSNFGLCASLPFKELYAFIFSVLEKQALMREAGALATDESLQEADNQLTLLILDTLKEAAQVQVDYLLEFFSEENACIECTPLVYSLMMQLVSPASICRASSLVCMLVLAKRLPTLFTHSLRPLIPVQQSNTVEVSGDFEPETAATGDLADAAKGKNKNQKKKRKKAALAVASSLAIQAKMDASIADPGTWPPLNLLANTQLRLFVGRCDPSVEVVIDAESMWDLLGLRSLAEKEADGERILLNDRPRHEDLLPPTALATRLLLESTRKHPDVQVATAQALQRCLNGKSQDEIDHVLDYWLEIYHCLKETPEEPKDTSHRHAEQKVPEMPKYRLQRLGLAVALAAIVSCSKTPGWSTNSTAPVSDSPDAKKTDSDEVDSKTTVKQSSTKAGAWLQKIFRFLVQEGLHDPDEDVRYAMLQAGLNATRVHGVTNLQQLLPILEGFLNKAPNVAELDMVRQSVVILLGSLAKYLTPEDQRVGAIFSRLLAIINFPADVVQNAVEDCLAPLAPKLPPEQLEKVCPRLMATLMSNSGYAERRGAAYALAGIVRGCGLVALKQYSIVDKLMAGLSDKSSKHRESSLFVFERLSLGLGKLFEPYVVRLIPGLLDCFGDANTAVREAAAVTSQAVMSKLSAHGIKLILPILLKVIDEDSSWRTKCQAVNVLATMTNCAPKQLSSCLPQIVPRLLAVLVDSQEGVKKAGADALAKIGTVIRNPEVQALVPYLIATLQDSLADKMTCLQMLRDTCFTHIVDAACLALIMPVLQRAFDDRSTDIRKIAAQIFGTLYSLSRKEDLEPYIPRILPGLRSCLLDPVPEVRSVTARALGAMVRGVGESCSKDLLPWLMSTLTSDQSSVDRSGAAQGLAEVLGAMGVQRLQSILPEFIKTAEATNIQPFVRDGYLMLFVYLPEVFSTDFVQFIGQILPPIRKALADECEYLRDTALKAGQRIIDLFSEEAVELLLPELEVGLADADWRIRHSSLQLTGDLLYKLSGSSGKGTTTTADEDDTFGTNMASRRILEALGTERRNRVLARLHIARSDPTYVVRQAASHIWKIVVDNTPRTLRDLMPTLIQLLISSLGSPIRDQQQVAGRALGDLVRKLGERILPEIVPYLEEGLNVEDGDRRRGVCNGLIEIMRNSVPDQIASFADRLTSPIRRSLCDSSPEVRKAGARAFDLLYAAIGTRAIDEILPALFTLLDQPETNPQALDGIRQLLVLRGKAVMPYLVPQLTQPKLDAKTFAFFAPIAGDSLSRHLNKILPCFLLAARDVPASDVDNSELQSCAVVLTSIAEVSGVRTILQELVTGLCLTESSSMAAGTTVAATAFRQGSSAYCYASLRLLHVYLEICCTLDEAESAATGAPTVEKGKLHTVRSNRRVLPDSDSSDKDADSDDSDAEDDDDDDNESFDEDDDEEDEGSSDNFSDSGERPDPREVVRRLLPEFYPSMLRNFGKLLTVSDDKILLFTWSCLESLLKYWAVVDMSAQANELRQAIKSAAGEFLRSQPPQIRRDRRASTTSSGSSQILVPGFSRPNLPLPCLVRFYSECILRGRQEAKQPAAQGLSECVTLSSGPALQPCVIKILGPMIRLLGERQPSSVRIAVVDSLATLIEKCPTATRPFTPQLQATFTKALGDAHRQIRLLGGRGLANIAAITPKIDQLLTELAAAVTSKLNPTAANAPSSGPYVQALAAAGLYPDTSLNALRLCLEKSVGKARISALKTVVGQLLSISTLDKLPSLQPQQNLSQVEDAPVAGVENTPISAQCVRRSASACVGAALASAHGYACRLRDGPKLPTDEVCELADFEAIVPWLTKQTSDSVLLQTYALAIMAMCKVRPSSLLREEEVSTTNLRVHSLRIVSDCCLNSQAAIYLEGFRALAYWLGSAVELKVPPEDILSLIQLLSRAFKLDDAEGRMFAAHIAEHLAWRIDLQDRAFAATCTSWITHLIALLTTASRDRSSVVCVASEEALAILCQLGAPGGGKDSDAYKFCLENVEAAKRPVLEEVLSRLKKRNWNHLWQRGRLEIDDTLMDS